jgi:hypothetical protein
MVIIVMIKSNCAKIRLGCDQTISVATDISQLQWLLMSLIRVDSIYQNYIFGLIWLSAKILKNTQNINGVRLKMPTSPGLTPLTRCRFITKKICYK